MKSSLQMAWLSMKKTQKNQNKYKTNLLKMTADYSKIKEYTVNIGNQLP